MANAEIQTIGGKQVLVINQTTGSGTVNVLLAKGGLVQGQNYYAGDMSWEGNHVDVIDSQFSNDTGVSGAEGPVKVAIVLTDPGNQYSSASPASPNQDGTGSLEYISQAVSDDSATLTFTYSEPAQDADTGQVKMYFQTTMGVIDPAEEVDREPR